MHGRKGEVKIEIVKMRKASPEKNQVRQEQNEMK